MSLSWVKRISNKANAQHYGDMMTDAEVAVFEQRAGRIEGEKPPPHLVKCIHCGEDEDARWGVDNASGSQEWEQYMADRGSEDCWSGDWGFLCAQCVSAMEQQQIAEDTIKPWKFMEHQELLAPTIDEIMANKHNRLDIEAYLASKQPTQKQRKRERKMNRRDEPTNKKPKGFKVLDAVKDLTFENCVDWADQFNEQMRLTGRTDGENSLGIHHLGSLAFCCAEEDEFDKMYVYIPGRTKVDKYKLKYATIEQCMEDFAEFITEPDFDCKGICLDSTGFHFRLGDWDSRVLIDNKTSKPHYAWSMKKIA